MVAMLTPLMMVPPALPRTPQQASIPGTPRRARSRSKTPIPSRPRTGTLPPLLEAEPASAATSEPPAPLSEPSALPPGQPLLGPLAPQSITSEPHAPLSEPSALPPGHVLHDAVRRQVRLFLNFATGVTRVGHHGILATSLGAGHGRDGLSQPRGEANGVPDQSPAPGGSRRTSGADQSQDLNEPNATATALLSFCQDCGEQHRTVLGDGLSHCVRCLSTATVTNPSQVISWFDEVLEQEAVDQYFVEKTTGSSAPPTSTSFLAHDHFGMPSFTSATPSRSLERLQVLRRHGREMAGRTG